MLPEPGSDGTKPRNLRLMRINVNATLGFNSSISLVVELERMAGLRMVQMEELRNFLLAYTFSMNQQLGTVPKKVGVIISFMFKKGTAFRIRD